jgi:hypothetical protein
MSLRRDEDDDDEDEDDCDEGESSHDATRSAAAAMIAKCVHFIVAFPFRRLF